MDEAYQYNLKFEEKLSWGKGKTIDRKNINTPFKGFFSKPCKNEGSEDYSEQKLENKVRISSRGIGRV